MKQVKSTVKTEIEWQTTRNTGR